jgi:hypothetical protein
MDICAMRALSVASSVEVLDVVMDCALLHENNSKSMPPK